MGEPAPLIATPLAPVPAGGAASWFTGAGGARLRAAIFPAQRKVRGSVVLSGGRTEPIEKYFEVIEDLTARGFVVLAHDWRGQGLSQRLLPDRLLGHARGYKDFLADFEALLAVSEPVLPKPWIAMGHSMGGCLTALALAKGEQRFAAAALSAPMLGIRTGGVPASIAPLVAASFSALGRAGVAARPPAAGPPTPFADNILTHDAARYARNLAQEEACPDLALGGPTWGWIDFAFKATGELQRGPGTPRIAIPVLVCAAGEDRLVDNAASRQVTARMPKGRYVEIPGAYHEILQETDDIRAAFWREFDQLMAELAWS